MTVTTFNLFVYIWIGIAIVIFPFVLRITAPYGRHATPAWGPLIDNRTGWIVMESPALLLFGVLFLTGKSTHTIATWIFFTFWITHYVNRTIVFPFRLHTKGKKMPLAIVLMAFCFNLVNGFINGYYLGSLADRYDNSWLVNPFFILGLVLCITGLFINWQADTILIHLRKPGETGYKIPSGGLFRLISCPNHFGEIVEWCGFTVMTLSWPALAFALWTIVNLIPRAIQHHRWYKNKFPDYPVTRKAVFPFIF
jgi:3-oxo-5-alpha-steroid 4-dehydrogenase 1